MIDIGSKIRSFSEVSHDMEVQFPTSFSLLIQALPSYTVLDDGKEKRE